jgi:phosphoribosyl 1,2-cyclic phosphodiesterase
MSIYITSLNSGSNGNCYYIGNDTEAVLVDAGISCRETEKRLHLLGLTMNKVKAIFISHEHTDHTRGIASLAAKYGLPVYITSHTWRRCNMATRQAPISAMAAHESISIGSLVITPFPKYHDAVDPHSFIVSSDGITIGVFTDIGAPCEHVTRYFRLCHAAFLETNYDEDMLERGRYPQHLKNRISSNMGHLSNRQALDLFLEHRPAFMTHLLLSHLSADNNNPALVQRLFDAHASGVKVVVASRYEQTPVYDIRNASTADPVRPRQSPPPFQLSLFGAMDSR